MLSYWEKSSFISYDFIVVGGGIVGFSTAVSLKEKHPKASILVLEAGFLPSGASTKNAGFACVGSLSEILEDLKTMSPNEVKALVTLRYEGLQLLRKRLGDTAIDYQACTSYELLMENELHLLDKVAEVNELLYPVFEDHIFQESSKNSNAFGFDHSVKALLQNKAEGAIHTGKMMKQLLLKVQHLGVEYKTHSRVTEVLDEGTEVQIKVANFDTALKAKKAFICTNAFTKTLIPSIDLKPGRGQVLITKPIPDLKFNGIYHFDGGYYYFRTIEGRILFGGGRNIDFETETTNVFDLNEKIQADLEAKLKTIICPNTAFEIDMRWSGIMAFGQDKKLLVKDLSENVIAGVRLGGMGVAIGSKLGEMLALKV
jgi:glycine/D-amino acid oxidase-like deaminating enzyme